MKEKKCTVTMYRIEEYDDRTIDTLLRCIAGVGFAEFVHNVQINKDGLRDMLTADDEPEQSENT